MADAKITELTDLGSSVATTDLIPVVDSTDTTTKKVTLANIMLLAHPVGSIYESVDSTSPATLFGGTWAALGAGQVLVGIDAADADFDTVEETGGAKTVVGDAHVHSLSDSGQAKIAISGVYTFMKRVDSSAWTITHAVTSSASGGVSGSQSVGAGLTGATDSTIPNATSVVQPYTVVYRWKRTA